MKQHSVFCSIAGPKTNFQLHPLAFLQFNVLSVCWPPVGPQDIKTSLILISHLLLMTALCCVVDQPTV